MQTTIETPDQLLERLDLMGLERVKTLHRKNHFEKKKRGVVDGWIERKEEELNPTPAPAVAKPDPAVQEALRIARRAFQEARKTQEAAAGRGVVHEAVLQGGRHGFTGARRRGDIG